MIGVARTFHYRSAHRNWHTESMQTSRTPFDVLTGIVLIVGPLVAVALKSFSFGWLMVMLMFGPIFVLIAGYIVQVIIAIQGFLVRRDLFGRARKRATIAAWVTTLAFVTVGIFFPDGGDSGYGSTFQTWLGAYGPNADAVHAATDSWSDAVGLIAALIWIAAFVWLFVEWVRALVLRRRGATGR